MTDPEVYVYTGEGGAEVPQDVVRVRLDPSVTSIPACAFDRRKKLAEVELSDGLVEIGEKSFWFCQHSIMKINIPGSPGGLTILLSIALFELMFVFTMTLKALETTHSVSAHSPILESRPSSL